MAHILRPFDALGGERLCLPAEWYNVSGPDYPGTVACPGKLIIRRSCGSSSGCYMTSGLFVKPGAYWVGYCFGVSSGSYPYTQSIPGVCPGSPFYVNHQAFAIDVWEMYRLGYWRSSLNIAVSATDTVGTSTDIIAGIGDDTLVNVTIARCFINNAAFKTVTPNLDCTPTNQASVNVYDDGRITVT